MRYAFVSATVFVCFAGALHAAPIVDLTGEKPTYKLVKVDLPVCKIDLADKDHKTWPRAIDEAIAEL